MSRQNAVGWDSHTEIQDVRHPTYGGSRPGIPLRRTPAASDDQRVPARRPSSLGSDGCRRGPARRHPLLLDGSPPSGKSFTDDGALTPGSSARSRPGETVNGALCSRLTVAPGVTESATFLLTWWFPNREVDFPQHGFPPAESPTGHIGNHYTVRFPSARAVAEYVRDHLPRLTRSQLYVTVMPCTTQLCLPRSSTPSRRRSPRFAPHLLPDRGRTLLASKGVAAPVRPGKA
jgi:hypothetical protein